jgi:hypothetical protein
MPQYALRTVRFPINNRCQFPSSDPASVGGLFVRPHVSISASDTEPPFADTKEARFWREADPHVRCQRPLSVLALALTQGVQLCLNLSSGVVAMKSAQDGARPDHTGSTTDFRH